MKCGRYSMTALSEAALDGLADALLPKLVSRGVMFDQTMPPSTGYSPNYDDVTCRVFLKPEHMGDTVVDRAATFFGLLERHGEVSSPDLVVALSLKGARSLPANLTNSLKKRARKMRIPVPWTETATPDGLRTIWKDRDGIAARMVKAIDDERRQRGLL
jgi:hypothetical protein